MELMDPRRGYEDILGFTNQTAILLSGMGAEKLIPQFKQKNISTEIMAELTIEDLQLLGADSELAHHMQKELLAISKRVSKIVLTPQQRLDQLSEVLVNSNKHLSLIQAFVTYARLRIKKEKIDSFIEINNNMRSSEALEIAIDGTIAEVRDAGLALEGLKQLFEDPRPRRNTHVYLAVIGGTGLVALLLARKYA